MNETGMSIKIGGPVRESVCKKIIELVEDGFNNLMGPNLEALLKWSGKENPEWNGTGNCDDLCQYLLQQQIPSEVISGECANPEITYWAHGMDSPFTINADMEGSPLIRMSTVRPLIVFLTDFIELGEAAFPLHLTKKEGFDSSIIARKWLKRKFSKEDLVKDLREITEGLFPIVPDLPPFTVIKG